ncbi:MAG: DNA repair protein RecO [Ignavibacteria bacterium GWB2_35_12]|nr:MAG: DNA repair protein RecO [Ignavibacteria bacterium GWA2_35_8]OGU42291.1 MAG: DNA repair protein RecO [Ignavibacteria bacterium GWB2_35_12]OGU86413.1 MAG: DNA repair protein RecO [Ignavibacteria bacterium RIFOXYA2_FULL_35_10]OGV22133.1 MAG: DNA repair protein RecO [Ignavibacteria bacterium RIFOXYC2_FULL_35_21]
MIINTEAIILKSIKYGDSSKILSIFTRDFGRLSVIAKGARQTKSKFGAALEPMSVSNLCFYKKANRDLHTLSSADSVINFNNIQNSLENMACAMMILESVLQTLVENEMNINLFELLKSSLIELNKTTGNPFSIFTLFQIELAHNLGFSMKFDYNYENLMIKSKSFIFSLENGYIVNEKNNKSKFFFRLENEVLAILNKIEKAKMEEVSNINISISNRKQIKDFFINYFSFHLEKPFGYKTFRLLK